MFKDNSSAANCYISYPDMRPAVAYTQWGLPALAASAKPSADDKIVADRIYIHQCFKYVTCQNYITNLL